MTEKNVLLVCGGGASSGFLAQNIRKAAQKRDMSIEIKARSESEIDEYLDEMDVLLIAPHLRYMESDIRDRVQSKNIPVAVIDQTIYGMLDGNKCLDLIIGLLD